MRQSIITALLLGILGLCEITRVQAAEPNPLMTASRKYDIAPQPVSDALNEFARQSGLQVVIDWHDSTGVVSARLAGSFTPEVALGRLLAETALRYEFLNERTVAVHSQAGSASDGKGESWNLAQSSSAPVSEETSFQPSPQGGEGVQGADENKLSEIVVTAQRKEEKASKVPISMTALSQRTMDDLSIKSVADLATVVPGLALSSPPGGLPDVSDIGIRGIFGGVFNGTQPTTQLYIDETPIAIRQLSAAASRDPYPNIFDLDRVEVLRGPQGTLFGASAMGGAIRFITPQPNLTAASGFAKTDFGYTDGGDANYEVGAAYGAPIVSGTAAFRVSAWYQSLGGFIDQEDPFTGQILKKNANTSDAYVIRPAFTWAPTDALTITPAFYLQHQHNRNPDLYWVTDLPNPEGSHPVNGLLTQPMTDDMRLASLSIKYNFRGMSFVSDTSYWDRTSTAVEDFTRTLEEAFTNGNPFIPGLNSFYSTDTNISFTHTWQQEFRLSSQDPTSRVSWVAGAYYRHTVQRLQQLEPPDLTPLTKAVFNLTSEELFRFPNYIYNGQVLNYYNDFRTTDVSEALFGNVTVGLTQHLKADVGVRVDRLTVKDQTQFIAGPFAFLGAETSSVTLPDSTATPVTPKASLTYQFTDTDMVYASAGKGYRSGGGNSVAGINSNPFCQKSLNALGLTSAPQSFNPDSLWSYELGTKDSLLDRRLSIDGSIYYIKWNDIQSTISLPSCSSAFGGNRGEAISQGFDLQAAALVTENLKLQALVGYTNAYNPKTIYGPPNPNTGVPTLISVAGDKRGAVPWTAAANAEYSRAIDSLWSNARGYFRVDYRWTDAPPHICYADRPNSDPALCGIADPAYGILNLRLGVTHRGFDLSAYVNNATRSDPRLGYYHGLPGAPLFYASAIRPLTAGITLWYRY